MTEWIIISIVILLAAAYIARVFWFRARRWTGKKPGCCQPTKPSRPQQLTVKGKRM